MAQIEIENLTFTYPDEENPAVENINLQINEGDFVLICGQSGCGKTTLLRNLKKSIKPFGKAQGNVKVLGRDVDELDAAFEAEKIGYIFQQPEHQIVTDKVWHELAFGLENLGKPNDRTKLSVAENANYFGFADKLYDDVEKLSGGQKQLLNIASVMTMQPDVLILDEPTAQLDPISAEMLLSTIGRINRDFGTTVIITEHRLEKVLDVCDKLVVMEDGRITACGSPRKVVMEIKESRAFKLMPDAVKLYAGYENDYKKCPLNVGQARRWIAGSNKRKEIYRDAQSLFFGENKEKHSGEWSVKLSNIWFRYEKDTKDILKGVSLEIMKGEIFGIVGENGSGKSTMLSVCCKLLKPYRGKVKIKGSISMLVQDVQCLFLKDSVREEIEIMGNKNMQDEIINMMQLKDKMDTHPYDLSGGQQQRLGIAKVFLTDRDIYILDEPTKGMDEAFKEYFVEVLKELKKKGKTIIMVSHDLEFLSLVADRCGMFFDGNIISANDTKTFFRGNRYYTTEMEKILCN